MTTSEFSAQFDVLYNNIMSNQAPGLTEYEKSVFLTKAQDEIVKNHFSSKSNSHQEGFDDSPKRQIDFSMLMKTEECSSITGTISNKIDARSKDFEFPTKVLAILNEIVQETISTKVRTYVVVPITYIEYSRLMSKPYKYPIKSQVWRMLEGCTVSNTTTTEGVSTTTTVNKLVAGLIGNFANSSTIKYIVRYVRQPDPIILTDLTDNYSDVSINGKTAVTECELDSILHEEILQRAVEIAKATYLGDLQSSITLGQRSE